MGAPPSPGDASLIVTTTDSIEGRQVVSYLGIVSGEAVVGASAMRDAFAGVRDIVGGRSGAFEEEVRRGRQLALEDLATAAGDLGANGVVGVRISSASVGEGLLMVTVTGTAVLVS